MSSFEERLEHGNAPAWRPDQDDPSTIIGVITDIDTGDSEYQGSYPIVTIRLEDGSEKAIHAFHSVLRNELIKKQPKIGERIGVVFLGEVETKPGSRFKSYIGYKLRVDRQSGEFDWTKVGADPDPTDVNPAYKPEEQPKVTVPDDAADDDIPF